MRRQMGKRKRAEKSGSGNTVRVGVVIFEYTAAVYTATNRTARSIKKATVLFNACSQCFSDGITSSKQLLPTIAGM